MYVCIDSRVYRIYGIVSGLRLSRERPGAKGGCYAAGLVAKAFFEVPSENRPLSPALAV